MGPYCANLRQRASVSLLLARMPCTCYFQSNLDRRSLRTAMKSIIALTASAPLATWQRHHLRRRRSNSARTYRPMRSRQRKKTNRKTVLLSRQKALTAAPSARCLESDCIAATAAMTNVNASTKHVQCNRLQFVFTLAVALRSSIHVDKLKPASSCLSDHKYGFDSNCCV